jgi:hypothetical protein
VRPDAHSTPKRLEPLPTTSSPESANAESYRADAEQKHDGIPSADIALAESWVDGRLRWLIGAYARRGARRANPNPTAPQRPRRELSGSPPSLSRRLERPRRRIWPHESTPLEVLATRAGISDEELCGLVRNEIDRRSRERAARHALAHNDPHGALDPCTVAHVVFLHQEEALHCVRPRTVVRHAEDEQHEGADEVSVNPIALRHVVDTAAKVEALRLREHLVGLPPHGPALVRNLTRSRSTRKMAVLGMSPEVGERGLFAPALLVARPALTGFVPLTV